MENFFHGDKFYDSIEDLMIDLEIDEDNVHEFEGLVCFKGERDKVVTLSADWIIERIDEERFSEDGDEADKIYNILKEIDFTSINAKIPELYYETRMKFTITIEDLKEALK